jgi:predicted outer membrane repeat protein
MAVAVMVAGGLEGAHSARAAGTVGDGTPESCTHTTLAAALAGGGQVDFNCGPNPHIIVLASTLVPATGATTIDGAGLISLSASNVPDRRLFVVGASSALTLTQITLINATTANGPGAGIHNTGQLTLDGVTLRDIGAQGGWGGGGVYNNGVLAVRASRFDGNYSAGGGAVYNDVGRNATIENSQFHDNTVNGAYGGAITNVGNLTVLGSLFAGNTVSMTVECGPSLGYRCGGGAIMNYPGATLAITNSVFTGNTASHEGGAILNKGTLTAVDAAFTGNTAGDGGGGLYNNAATASLRRTSFSGNRGLDYGGGGLFNLDGDLLLISSTVDANVGNSAGGGLVNYGGRTQIAGSTFSGNSAPIGGGLYGYAGIITATHVTFSANIATGTHGGGLFNDEQNQIRLTYVTFAGNASVSQGAALHNVAHYGALLYLTNALFAGNHQADGTPLNCSGQAPAAASFSLSTDGTCLSAGNGNWLNTSAPLGPLAASGGDTLTHLPAPGSAPIDHGTCLGGLTVDQRGLPRQVGAGCDIGAVERQADDYGWYLWMAGVLR